MTKTLIMEIEPYVKLYRCNETGIAWVEDGRSGNSYSPHPNISSTGSVTGMKQQGYWNKADRTVKAHGFIFNTDQSIITNQYDEIARMYCRCGGKHNGCWYWGDYVDNILNFRGPCEVVYHTENTITVYTKAGGE